MKIRQFILLLLLILFGTNAQSSQTSDVMLFTAVTAASEPFFSVDESSWLEAIISLSVTTQLWNPNFEKLTAWTGGIFEPAVHLELELDNTSTTVELEQAVADAIWEWEIEPGLSTSVWEVNMHTNSSSLPRGNYTFLPVKYFASKEVAGTSQSNRIPRYNFTIQVADEITYIPPELPSGWGEVAEETSNSLTSLLSPLDLVLGILIMHILRRSKANKKQNTRLKFQK